MVSEEEINFNEKLLFHLNYIEERLNVFRWFPILILFYCICGDMKVDKDEHSSEE